MRRLLLLPLLLAAVCVASVTAAGITLSTGQSDYAVLVGEEAAFPIAIKNTFGADVTGVLARNVRFVPEAGEAATHSQSRAITLFSDTQEITVSAGPTVMPGTFFFDIAFEYGNAPRTRVVLPEIRIHVASSVAEEEEGERGPQVSSASMEVGSGGAQEGTSSTRQPGQIMQDTGSLREQAAREQDRMQALRSGLLAGLDDDPPVREIHAVLMSRGYTRVAATINPVDEATGSFSFEYRNSAGDTVRAEGAVVNGSAAYAAYATEKSLVVPDAVTANETYKRYAGELADAGFFPATSSMNATASTSSVGVGFIDGQNRTARIVATLSGGEVRSVDIEEPSDLLPLAGAGALCIILLIAYLVRRGAPKAPEPPVTPIPADPRGEALRLLAAARDEFDRGERKGAHGTASRALRSYVSSVYGTGAELADGDALRLLEGSGRETGAASPLLGRCAAVSYARSPPLDEEFHAAVEEIEAFIRRD